MDIHEHGPLKQLASSLGRILDTSTSGEAGEVEARAFHIERAAKPDLVIAASVTSTDVVAMLVERDGAANAMAACRVLVQERGDALRPGRVVTLPAGAPGARSVRGSTGAFAIVDPSAAQLPSSVDVLAVHAQPPLSEWEEATREEVLDAVPDLISRFRAPKPRLGSKAAAKSSLLAKPPPARTTVMRRRRPDE